MFDIRLTFDLNIFQCHFTLFIQSNLSIKFETDLTVLHTHVYLFEIMNIFFYH